MQFNTGCIVFTKIDRIAIFDSCFDMGHMHKHSTAVLIWDASINWTLQQKYFFICKLNWKSGNLDNRTIHTRLQLSIVLFDALVVQALPFYLDKNQNITEGVASS